MLKKEFENKDKVQMEHIQAWISKGMRGTSVAATGVGKTRMGLLAIDQALESDPNATALIIVPTENLRDNEWIDELKKWKLSHYKKRIEFQCIQTAYKYEEYHWNIVIVDEVHTTLSPEYRKFYENNSWDCLYCLTATVPENPEYKKFLKSIAPIVKKTTLDDALDEGLISPYKVYNLGVSFTPEEAKEYNKIDKLFILAQNKLGGPWEAFKNATKWRTSKDKDESKWANIFYIMMQKRKQLCFNVSSKIDIIEQIVNKYSNRRALVFSESIKFASTLQERLDDQCVTFHSKMKKKEREDALKLFGDGRTKKRVISSVRALNQGLNVPECSLGICAAGSSKALDNVQRTGRTLRLQENKIAIYFNLYVRGTQEVKWVRKRTKDEYNAKWIDNLNDI